MVSVIESSLRGEINALHLQILDTFNRFHAINERTGDGVLEFIPELAKLVGMLPEDMRPPEIEEYHYFPGPIPKKKKLRADDML